MQVNTDKDLSNLINAPDTVVTEKLDGENITIYSDYIHARSLDSGRFNSHSSRDWIKNHVPRIQYRMQDNWRICGEYLYAKHAIKYTELPHFFFVIAVFINNKALSWGDTKEFAFEFDLPTVPQLWSGKYDEAKVKACYTGKSIYGDSIQEGYVIRPTLPIHYSDWSSNVFKYVRPNHVDASQKHWMLEQYEKNELVK